jgi:aquaporin Z
MGESSAHARYVAEFIGTFMLVFTVGCVVITQQPVWGGVAIASILMVMIYALGKSSGANFNPAVSFSLGLSGKMEWSEVASYMAVQLAGGILAGICYSSMLDKKTSVAPVGDHVWWEAALAEVLYTFMLCFVVLNVAASKAHAGQNQFYGLAIGFVIVAGAYGAGSVSGGCFNPAVAFGLDISSTFKGINYCLLYTASELIGAALASIMFFICRPDEINDAMQKNEDGFYGLSSQLTSEFLGTFILVLTVGLNVLGKSTAGAFSIAASLMCMIFALGSASGAHFNPAVTLAIAARGKCSPKTAACYMVAQIAGGVAAAFTYSAMMGGDAFALMPEKYELQHVIAAEFFFTFVLAFVVLSVATVASPLSEYFGFAIGMCVTVGGFAIGKVSGGSLNPAVTMGISSTAMAMGKTGVSSGLQSAAIYTATELAAGAMAAGVFKLTQPSEFEKKTALP